MEFILSDKESGSGFERFIYVSNKPQNGVLLKMRGTPQM